MDLKFEEALAQLEEVVRSLEGGDTSLEDSMKLFEKGVALARLCHQQLDQAEAKIELLLEENGDIKKVPFDTDKQEAEG